MLRSLRTQILLWTILPLAAVLMGVALLGVNSHQTAMREIVAERDGALASTAAARLSEALADRARHLSSLDATRPDTWGSAVLDGGVALFDIQNQPVNAAPSRDLWTARAAHLPASGAFSLPFRENGAWRVLVVRTAAATPLPPNEARVVGAFTLPPLADVTSHAVAYLVDQTGNVIVHPDPGRVGESLRTHEGIAEVMRGESGTAFHHDTDGRELVVGYAPIAPTGWGLVIDEPWAGVVAPMFQYTVLLPVLLLLVAMVALGALYFGVRNVIRPLQDLAQIANRIAFGNYRAAAQPVGGVREITELRETLDSMARQLEEAQAAMQNYIVAITRGQEEERKRLARELHDDTIQSLFALRQRVELAQKALEKDPTLAATRLNDLKNMLSQTLDGVRRYVRDLRPAFLEEMGLIPALEMLAHEASAMLTIEGEERRLDPERELILFRMVQEALHNAAKYAQAQHISMQLSFEADEVRAIVEDDGVGFDAPETPAAYARNGHYGLMGMQERAQLFGGNVYVKSERGRGTKVVAYVPLNKGENQTNNQP